MAGFWSGFAEGMTEVKEREQERLLQEERLQEQRRAQEAGFDFQREMSGLEHTRAIQRSAFSAALSRRGETAKLAEEESAAVREARSFLAPEVVAAFQATGNLPGILQKFTVDKRTPETVEFLNAQGMNIVNTLGDKGVPVLEAFATGGYDVGQQVMALALQDENFNPGPLVTSISSDAVDYKERSDLARRLTAESLGLSFTTDETGSTYVIRPSDLDTSKFNRALVMVERRLAELQPTRGIGAAVEIVSSQIPDYLAELGLTSNKVFEGPPASNTLESQQILTGDAPNKKSNAPDKRFNPDLIDSVLDDR